MSETHFIDAEIHTTGRSHRSGYCSDPADFYDIDEFTTCKLEIPSKQFIKDHCDSDGEITWSGMEELSKNDNLEIYNEQKDYFKQLIETNYTDSLIDFGCGTGRYLEIYANFNLVHLVDISKEN